MLRYPATTISLAMAEVKEFERHRQYRRCLAFEVERARIQRDVGYMSQAQPVIHTSVEHISKGNERREDEDADKSECSKDTVLSYTDAILKLELPLSPRKTTTVDGAGEPSQRDRSHISQSTISESDSLQQTSIPATAALTTMPPTSLMDERQEYDQHSLPIRMTSRRSPGKQPSQKGPVTPSRSSSLAGFNLPVTSPEVVQSSANRTRILRSAVRYVGSYVRSSDRGSSSPWSEREPEERTESERSLQESSPRLRVYNDSLLASEQPSTPQHLPEARHQSRLQGSYTAPIPRSRQQGAYDSGIVRSGAGRTHSPPGLNTPGFRGLYGGVENADDLTLYEQATRSFDDRQDFDTDHDGS